MEILDTIYTSSFIITIIILIIMLLQLTRTERLREVGKFGMLTTLPVRSWYFPSHHILIVDIPHLVQLPIRPLSRNQTK